MCLKLPPQFSSDLIDIKMSVLATMLGNEVHPSEPMIALVLIC